MMWPFNKLQRKARRIEDNEFYRELFGAIQSKTGVAVNWRSAMQAITYMACARVISEGLAQVPCKLFKKSDGIRLPAEDHSLFGLLYDGPNAWQTGYDFFEQMGLHLFFCGNFFAFVNSYGGKIKEILPYEPQNVTVERDGWNLRYWVTVDLGTKGAERIEVPASAMWHIRGPSWNGWTGLEGVKLAREAIGLDLATEEHVSRIFANGAHIGGILSSDQGNINEDSRKRIRDSWIESQGGRENTGKVAVLWGGLKYMATTMMNDQAQLLESRNFQVEVCCRAARVLPIMVGHMNSGAATFASSEQMFLAHAVHTMGPWYRRVESSAKKFLLTEEERKTGHYVKFITAALLRGASKDRAEYFSKALGAGGAPAWMTQDEARELDELNPMGGNAAILREPTNVGGAAGGKQDGKDAAA